MLKEGQKFPHILKFFPNSLNFNLHYTSGNFHPLSPSISSLFLYRFWYSIVHFNPHAMGKIRMCEFPKSIKKSYRYKGRKFQISGFWAHTSTPFLYQFQIFAYNYFAHRIRNKMDYWVLKLNKKQISNRWWKGSKISKHSFGSVSRCVYVCNFNMF